MTATYTLNTLNTLKKILANREFGENITVSKRKMRGIPTGCRETSLGYPDGARRQYRCNHNIHILEYPDRYKVHKDRVDPRKDPVGHLIYDSSETLAALGVAGAVGKMTYDRKKGKSKNAILEAIILSIITGIGTYYLGKDLKNM